MDDKNKYNNALEKLQEALAPKDGREISGLTRACIESIFPELKESEDERIRKEIIRFIQMEVEDEIVGNKWLAWLKKQGKQEQLYIRFGEIPTDEKSKIYQGEIEVGTENGVSVYPAFETSDGDIVLGLNLPITKTTLYTQQHLLEYDDRPCYLVKGNYVSKDTDGQPLIKNVKIIKEIKHYRMKQDKENNIYKIDNTSNCGISVYNEELKEPDDERIRKEIIEYIKTGTYHKDWIAWLEKKESVEEIVERCKDSWYNEGKIAGMAEGLSDDEKYQQGWHDAIEKKEEKFDNANKVEPKFKVGDWIIDKSGFVQQVLDFRGGIYTCTYNSFTTDCESNYHLWTIEDAKDGDVLVSNYGKPFIYNGNHNSIRVGAYCGISTSNTFTIAREKCHWTENQNIRPANKEQHNALMKAMADAGYTFDFDKKELKKIGPKLKVKYAGSEYNVLEIKEFPGGIIYYGIEDEPNHIDYVLPENCEIISGYGVKEKGNSYPTKSAIFSQQNPAWGQEDEKNLMGIIDEIAVNKSESPESDYETYDRFIDWLKSLKNRIQPHWKPSDEQIKALEHFVRGIGESGYISPYDANLKLVHSLLNDLKKLK